MTTKHRALIVGAGRIGSGYGWAPTPMVYTHADAYLALGDRVELLGFVEPDEERAHAAEKEYGVPAINSLVRALKEIKPDIVSICTQPNERAGIIDACISNGVKAIWCEKPLAIERWAQGRDRVFCNVNYWRRADSPHHRIKRDLDGGLYGEILRMVVIAKRDVHTVCHLTNLALWWGVPKDRFTYVHLQPPDYTEFTILLYTTKALLTMTEGGIEVGVREIIAPSRWFPGIKMIAQGAYQSLRLTTPYFMETMLGNLLDAMEGRAELLSPPEDAIKAEEWADEILKENA